MNISDELFSSTLSRRELCDKLEDAAKELTNAANVIQEMRRDYDTAKALLENMFGDDSDVSRH